MKFRNPYFTFLFLAAFIIIFYVSPTYSQSTPGTDFPFARVELRTPPFEDPLPGMGNSYSALSQGIESVLWNPASLSKIEHAQSTVSFISELKSYEYNYAYETEDGEETYGSEDRYRLSYYLTGDETVTAAVTREHTAHSIYRTQATGINFKQAFKFNDWLSFGILSHSHAGANLDLSGLFPAIAKSEANFYNSSDFLGTELSIDSSGYLTYTYSTEGGSTYQYKTVEPLWDGFLSQKNDIPVSAIVEARNDISINPGITLCGALKWNKFSFGTSLTPISANANVSNNVRGIIKEGTPDIFIYQPDVDPDDEQEALNWVQDPNLYGSEAGYKINTVDVPAGEVVAEGLYQGFYQASALRADLGLTYDVSDILTLGLSFENFGGASLNFKGSGRVAYVNTRVATTEPPSSFDPTEEFHWVLFNDSFEPVEDTEDLFLQEEVNVGLPQKMRIGLALKKPFLIAVDYEQNQTPIKLKQFENGQEKLITVSDLKFLRIGMESRVLFLPMWIRSSMPLMFKPTITGLDADDMEKVDDAFQYGVLPAGTDLGADINFWGTFVGGSLGFSINPILALYQLDSLNPDLGKIGYYNLYAKRDPWKVTYLATIDPGSTAGAFTNRTDKDDTDPKMEYLRWIQTFTISYKF